MALPNNIFAGARCDQETRTCAVSVSYNFTHSVSVSDILYCKLSSSRSPMIYCFLKRMWEGKLREREKGRKVCTESFVFRFQPHF